MVDRPKLSWPEAKAIIEGGRLDLLGRSVEQQTTYSAFRAKIQEEWVSVSDYILASKLQYSATTAADGRRAAIRPTVIEAPRTVLLENDFPYHFDTGIRHFVLWKIGGEEVLPSDISSAVQQLRSTHRATDTAVYINPPHLKSILDLEHAHILFISEEAVP
jgi:hypothetical protein